MSHQVESWEPVCGIAEQLVPRVRPTGDLGANDIYYGSVMLPGGTRRERAYVKVFRSTNTGLLILNEVLSYVLAVQCGLPTPLTFPCACNKALLRKGSAVVASHEGNSQFILAVASVDVGAMNIHQRSSTTAYKWAEIMNWPHVAKLAVFDELVGNDDRHIDNLVRRGLNDYVPIDNERIVFGERWFAGDISGWRERRCDANILADAIAEGTDEVMRQRMISYAQYFIRETVFEVPDLSDRIERLCGAPEGSVSMLIDFLNSRRMILPYLMQWHMQKGDLFRASSTR